MIKKSIHVINKLSEVLSCKQKRLFWVVAVAALISAMFETLGVSIIVPLVNAMLMPEQLFAYSWMQPFIIIFHINSNQKMVIIVVAGTIGLYITKNAYSIFFSWIKAKYSSKVQRECSISMMKSYMNRGYSYFLSRNSNEIIQGVTSDVQGLYNILNSILYSITKLFIVALIAIWMFISDWQLAGSLVASSGICLFFLMKFLKKPMRTIGDRVRDYTIDSNKVLLQAIQGIKEVIVMRKQHEFIDQYEYYMYKRQKEDIKRSVYTDVPNNIVEAFCVSAIMLVLCVKVVLSNDLAEFISVLAAFAVGAFRIMPAIGYLSSSFNTIVSCLPHLESVYNNMTESKKYDKLFSNIDIKDNPLYADHIFQKDISVNHVFFAYAEGTTNVLNDLSITIEKDTSIALVGESGAGKSTLADIILGVLPIERGSVCIDDIDIREIPNLWGRLIGFVPQSIYLCDTSIAENVAFGVRKDKIDIDRVREALKMANVLDFVESLPDTIWAQVGDRGVRISGGQRQRIGIARAIYGNPQILVLDEATSALDNETEQSVMEAIDSLQGNLTIIIIAHRLTTIKNCDVIYEIKDGRAVLRTYEELI